MRTVLISLGTLNHYSHLGPSGHRGESRTTQPQRIDPAMTAPQRKHVPQTIVDRRQALVRNIERTLRLIELNAPDVIIGNDIALLFARACAVYPDAAKEYADRLIKDSRRNSWLCDMCDAELANDEEKSLGTCRPCLDSCQIDHDGQEPL